MDGGRVCSHPRCPNRTWPDRRRARARARARQNRIQVSRTRGTMTACRGVGRYRGTQSNRFCVADGATPDASLLTEGRSEICAVCVDPGCIEIRRRESPGTCTPRIGSSKGHRHAADIRLAALATATWRCVPGVATPHDVWRPRLFARDPISPACRRMFGICLAALLRGYIGRPEVTRSASSLPLSCSVSPPVSFPPSAASRPPVLLAVATTSRTHSLRRATRYVASLCAR